MAILWAHTGAIGCIVLNSISPSLHVGAVVSKSYLVSIRIGNHMDSSAIWE